MTVFRPGGQARTMDFKANDIGYVPIMAGHYIENTGNTNLVFLEMFRADQFMDFSLDNWIRRLPPEIVTAHLNFTDTEIRTIPAEKREVIAG
jgi:oxalate decarboxylase